MELLFWNIISYQESIETLVSTEIQRIPVEQATEMPKVVSQYLQKI